MSKREDFPETASRHFKEQGEIGGPRLEMHLQPKESDAIISKVQDTHVRMF